MGVEVFHTELIQAPNEPGRLEPISRMPYLLPQAGRTQVAGGRNCAKRKDRSRNEQDECRQQQPERALSEDDLGPFGLASVGGILEVGSRSANRETMHVMTGALGRFDFAPDERMAHRRIEVAQIS
jgi:hypothetical protein